MPLYSGKCLVNTQLTGVFNMRLYSNRFTSLPDCQLDSGHWSVPATFDAAFYDIAIMLANNDKGKLLRAEYERIMREVQGDYNCGMLSRPRPQELAIRLMDNGYCRDYLIKALRQQF